jgi:hypothetical protein
MPLNPNQELVNYYLEKTKQKCTSKVYTRYLSSFKSLRTAGYTDMDIKSVVDYLVDHPPRQGFTPPFIQYVIEETLQKIRVQQMTNVQAFFESPEEVIDNNLEKFKSQDKKLPKGMVKF